MKLSDSETQNALTLPEGLLMWEILPKLPAKSLLRFKSVSKEWRDFIGNDDRLTKAHARRHTAPNANEILSIVFGQRNRHQKLWLLSGQRQTSNIGTPPELKEFHAPPYKIVDLLGSSNGLVLLTVSPDDEFLMMWNPATREYKLLPETLDNFSIADIGFDDETGDHKVIQVYETDTGEFYTDESSLRFRVFSKRSGSWRELETLPKFLIYGDEPRGVSIDGVFYFLASKVNRHNKNVIFSVTHRSEEVRRVIDAPLCHWPDGESLVTYKYTLVKWKENSLALLTETTRKYPGWDFRVMIKNVDGHGKNVFCWSKLFVFDHRPDIRGLWSDRYLIIQKNSGRSTKLALRDPQRTDERDREIRSFRDSYFYIVDYVPTLVSVNPNQ